MKNPVARLPFRILAGLIGAFLLLVGLPASLLEAQTGSLEAWFFAVCCLVGGIGMALGAYTGRWFNTPV